MPTDIHIQHMPCVQCGSLRTIQMDVSSLKQTLYCPDCGHAWEREIPAMAGDVSRPTWQR
jgi:hypothetical protein